MSNPVADLVSRAENGDKQAWDALVERYAPLIWSICRTYRLSQVDAEDAAQSVWLQLVSSLGRLRDPAALPGWLATTTRRECARIRRTAPAAQAAGSMPDVGEIPEELTRTAEEELMASERHAVFREALAGLPAVQQRLIVMLTADPPVPYVEISAVLGIAQGSIGPTRARCLEKLRRHPAIAALIDADATAARGQRAGHMS